MSLVLHPAFQDSPLWPIIQLTLWVSGSAVLIAALLGIPLGAWLGLRRFRGQQWLTAFIYTGMGFPPVVVGLFVYLILSRQGVLGSANLLFTPTAMIIAQTILAVPLITGITMSAVRAINPDLGTQLRALGATNRQILTTILREARGGALGLLAGRGRRRASICGKR